MDCRYYCIFFTETTIKLFYITELKTLFWKRGMKDFLFLSHGKKDALLLTEYPWIFVSGADFMR